MGLLVFSGTCWQGPWAHERQGALAVLRAVLCSELLCCLPFGCRVLVSSRASRGPIGYCGIHLVSTTPTVVVVVVLAAGRHCPSPYLVICTFVHTCVHTYVVVGDVVHADRLFASATARLPPIDIRRLPSRPTASPSCRPAARRRRDVAFVVVGGATTAASTTTTTEQHQHHAPDPTDGLSPWTSHASNTTPSQFSADGAAMLAW